MAVGPRGTGSRCWPLPLNRPNVSGWSADAARPNSFFGGAKSGPESRAQLPKTVTRPIKLISGTRRCMGGEGGYFFVLPSVKGGENWPKLAGRIPSSGRGGGGGTPPLPHTQREAGCGGPEDGGVWAAKSVKRPPQQPAQPRHANYWAPLTHKRHILPHPAQPRHTNHWALRTWKRHQQEHRPQRPTERSDPTQHAKGRTGDCPGPRSCQMPCTDLVSLTWRKIVCCAHRPAPSSPCTHGGCSWSGPDPKGGGVPPPKWLYRTMGFVGAGDFV